MTFAQPATEMFQTNDYPNHLLLIENVGPVETVSTKIGESDAVRADVTVLTDPSGPKEFRQTYVFGKALIGTLQRAAAGAMTLGRLGQGPASPGKNPAWILEKFTEQDAAYAQSYIDGRNAARAQQSFAAPAAAPQPVAAPAPQPVAAPVPQVPAAAPVYAAPAVPQVPAAAPAPAYAPPPAAPAFAPPAAAPAPQAVNAATISPEEWATLPPSVQQALQAQAAAPPF